jgi:hypothetical protein
MASTAKSGPVPFVPETFCNLVFSSEWDPAHARTCSPLARECNLWLWFCDLSGWPAANHRAALITVLYQKVRVIVCLYRVPSISSMADLQRFPCFDFL